MLGRQFEILKIRTKVKHENITIWYKHKAKSVPLFGLLGINLVLFQKSNVQIDNCNFSKKNNINIYMKKNKHSSRFLIEA